MANLLKAGPLLFELPFPLRKISGFQHSFATKYQQPTGANFSRSLLLPQSAPVSTGGASVDDLEKLLCHDKNERDGFW
jgi:hypothetical protein